jgi:MFS family permease
MRRFDVGIGIVGPAIAVSMGGFGIIGGLLGGPMADRFCRGSLSKMAGVTAAMISALLPLSLICIAGPTMTVSVLFNGLFNLLVPGYLAGLHALIIGLTTTRVRGFMISLLALMFTLVGYGLGSQLIGMLSDAFGARGVANPLMAALIVSTVTLAWAVVHLLLARRHIVRSTDRTLQPGTLRD